MVKFGPHGGWQVVESKRWRKKGDSGTQQPLLQDQEAVREASRQWKTSQEWVAPFAEIDTVPGEIIFREAEQLRKERRDREREWEEQTKKDDYKHAVSKQLAALPRLVLSPISKKSRYEFDEAPLKFQVPHVHDVVFTHAKAAVARHHAQLSAFERFTNPVTPETLSAAPTRFFAYETVPAVHALVRDTDITKVQLKLVYSNVFDFGTAKVVLLNGKEGWVDLEGWMETQLMSGRITGRRGYKLQWRWWNRLLAQSLQVIGKPPKHFRFLELPSELQDHMLLHLLGPRSYLLRTDHHTVSFTEGSMFNSVFGTWDKRLDTDVTLPPTIPPTNTDVLYLNKTLRRRTLKILHKDTIKVFDASERLADFGGAFRLNGIPSPLPQTDLLYCLRHIDLAFRHVDYIGFFGVKLPPFRDVTGEAPAAILQRLPKLKSIDLFFRSTASIRSSPWYKRTNPPYLDVHRYPCCKTMVDWIMCFAFDYVKHLKQATITGYVKAKSVEKWDENFANRRSKMYVMHVEAHKAEVAGLRGSQVPPLCECPQPCGYIAVDNLEFQGKACEYREAYRAYKFDHNDSFEETSCHYVRHKRDYNPRGGMVGIGRGQTRGGRGN